MQLITNTDFFDRLPRCLDYAYVTLLVHHLDLSPKAVVEFNCLRDSL